MSQSSPSTKSNTASQSPMLCHASYQASISCKDQRSIVDEAESGIFDRWIKLEVDEKDLIWCSHFRDKPNHPFVPTPTTTYSLNAKKEPTATGRPERYSLTNGYNSLLPGISARLVCDKEPSGWQSLFLGEEGPWKRDEILEGPWKRNATLYVSRIGRHRRRPPVLS